MFIFAFFLPFWYGVAVVFLLAIGGLLLYEAVTLHRLSKQISIHRSMAEKLFLGDIQEVQYKIDNSSQKALRFEFLDELPYQFQQRAAIKNGTLKAATIEEFTQAIKPLQRGNLSFGDLHCLISLPKTDLLSYRVSQQASKAIEVHPSVIKMNQYAMFISNKTALMAGIRKIRTVGENDEFEHLKSYSQGDNIKSINWKATSRKGELMVNQYQDARSQQVYFVLDKGRTMEMPFDGLSLLDHGINATLVLSNIVLKKYDQAGLFTFSNRVDTMVKADATSKQLQHISNKLYAQETEFKESNFETLYHAVYKGIRKRSILFVITNFENIVELEKNVIYFNALSKKHLLVVISFINSELVEHLDQPIDNRVGVYTKSIGKMLIREKETMMKLLQTHGIQTILTKPEDLSINLINKYLEIKAKQMR